MMTEVDFPASPDGRTVENETCTSRDGEKVGVFI